MHRTNLLALGFLLLEIPTSIKLFEGQQTYYQFIWWKMQLNNHFWTKANHPSVIIQNPPKTGEIKNSWELMDPPTFSCRKLNIFDICLCH